MAKFEAQISFGVGDLKENPNAALSKICGEWLWENRLDSLSISDLFVLQKIPALGIKVEEKLRKLYFKIVESLHREKIGGKEDSSLVDFLHILVLPPFSVSHNYELSGVPSKAGFSFSGKWDFVGVTLNTTKNKRNIVKKTDSYWLDFFEGFSQGITQEDCTSFDGILNNVIAHHRKVWERA